MTFGERLRRARLASGMTQAGLADERFSISYISHLESGRRPPNPAVVAHCERMLGLEPGALEGRSWGATSARDFDAGAPPTPDDVDGLAARALRAWRTGAAEVASQASRAGVTIARVRNRRDAWWQLVTVGIEAENDLAHHQTAAALATSLIDHPWVRSCDDLTAQACLLASRSHRMAGHLDEALQLAQRALDLTPERPPGEPVRMSAVIAAIAARHPDVEQLTADLEAGLARLQDPAMEGPAAWTLGNLAFAVGDTERGLALHRRADRVLTPAVSFRHWARFARASADERVRVGLVDGVEPLLIRARIGLEALGNPMELAALAETEAAYFTVRGQYGSAMDALDAAIRSEDLPRRVKGRLYHKRAQIHLESGSWPAASLDALEAARACTEAGLHADALEAWTLRDLIEHTMASSRGSADAIGGPDRLTHRLSRPADPID